MPIYEQTYRRYEARAPLRAVRFWPITREALRLILARRAFLGLLLVAWGQFLFRVIQIYVVSAATRSRPRVAHRRAHVRPVPGHQTLFTLLACRSSAARSLIANDCARARSLVYLSRPLTRRDYVWASSGCCWPSTCP
jgi:hypothetical protein